MGYQTIIDLENGAPDICAEHSGELHDVNDRESQTGHGRLLRGQGVIGRKLPWSGLLDARFSATHGKEDVPCMDMVPVRYDLHSNMMFRQLSGFYENQSALRQES